MSSITTGVMPEFHDGFARLLAAKCVETNVRRAIEIDDGSMPGCGAPWRRSGPTLLIPERHGDIAAGASGIEAVMEDAGPMSRILHRDAAVLTNLIGAASISDCGTNDGAADLSYRQANACMAASGRGTAQIKRNVISERVLGLPRELLADRDIPFQESRAMIG